MKNNPWKNTFLDRSDSDYQQMLVNLLQPEELMRSAEIMQSVNPNTYRDKRIVIRFSGISSLTLLGGTEGHNNEMSSTAKAFRDLLKNADKLLPYKLDIQFLFAYPYSDFIYSLISAESTRHRGFTIDCLRNNNDYISNFYTPKKLTFSDLISSSIYADICSSLKRLQGYMIDGGEGFNSHPDNSHRIVIKFSPINIMTSLLVINNNAFIEPYTYSKGNRDYHLLSKVAPISHVKIDTKEEWEKIFPKDTTGYYTHIEHYYGLIGHFRYLWHHPVCITSHDCTHLTRGVEDTLDIFKKPMEISYKGKAQAIKLNNNFSNNACTIEEIDYWQQYIRNEMLRHCSKFVDAPSREIDITSKRQIKLGEVPVFIVGAWKRGDVNNYMKIIRFFFASPVDFIINFLSEGIPLDNSTVRGLLEYKLKVYKDPGYKNLSSSARLSIETISNKIREKMDAVVESIKALELYKTARKELKGMCFSPILIDTDDTEEIRQAIYKNMNQSQLGFVIQTNDIADSPLHQKIMSEIKSLNLDISEESMSRLVKKFEEHFKHEYYSKPNVYLEKGYLMGKLGKRIDRFGKEIEAVCVFKEQDSHTESDNITFTHTSFANSTEFKVQLYRVIKWLWNITEIDTKYILDLLHAIKSVLDYRNTAQELINLTDSLPLFNEVKGYDDFKMLLRTAEDEKINYQRHSYKIQSFINEVETWKEKFDRRFENNFSYLGVNRSI